MRTILAGLFGLMVAILAADAGLVHEEIGYDRANPVIYDNDGAIESGFTSFRLTKLTADKPA